MRISIVQKPAATRVDDIQLDHVKSGRTYEVSRLVGAPLLAEGWAEPSIFEKPPPIAASSHRELLKGRHDPARSANLVREILSAVSRSLVPPLPPPQSTGGPVS